MVVVLESGDILRRRQHDGVPGGLLGHHVLGGGSVVLLGGIRRMSKVTDVRHAHAGHQQGSRQPAGHSPPAEYGVRADSQAQREERQRHDHIAAAHVDGTYYDGVYPHTQYRHQDDRHQHQRPSKARRAGRPAFRTERCRRTPPEGYDPRGIDGEKAEVQRQDGPRIHRRPEAEGVQRVAEHLTQGNVLSARSRLAQHRKRSAPVPQGDGQDEGSGRDSYPPAPAGTRLLGHASMPGQPDRHGDGGQRAEHQRRQILCGQRGPCAGRGAERPGRATFRNGPPEAVEGQQAEQRHEGIHARFLRVPEYQRRTGAVEGSQRPGMGPAQTGARGVEKRHQKGSGTGGQQPEYRVTLAQHPCEPTKQQEVQRGMEIHRGDGAIGDAVGEDLGHGQPSAIEAQALIPPDALGLDTREIEHERSKSQRY